MAKNIDDFLNDLKEDETLREALAEGLAEGAHPQDLIAFAASKGYDFSLEDMEALKDAGAELSDEELQNVAGGGFLESLGCIVGALLAMMAS